MSFTADGRKIRQKAIIESDSIDIEFDVSENETHRSSATVTKHPVEQGADVADHIQVNADALDLIARVTNTPIVTEQEARALNADRVAVAYDALLRLKRDRVLVSVLTTLRSYRNMAIVDVTVTRNAQTGECLAVAVKLEEIFTATSTHVPGLGGSADLRNADPLVLRGKPLRESGKKPTDAAPDAVAEKSETLLLRFGRKLSSSIDRVAQ